MTLCQRAPKKQSFELAERLAISCPLFSGEVTIAIDRIMVVCCHLDHGRSSSAQINYLSSLLENEKSG